MKKKYKIKGMDCASCAALIEIDLEDAGIRSACSYAKEELEIEFAPGTKEEKIKQIVETSGYELII